MKQSLPVICLFIIFILLAIFYVANTIGILQVLLTLNANMTKTFMPPFTILNYYPSYALLPIVFSLAAIIFVHIALKILDRSPLAWLLGLIFAISIPIPLIRLLQFLFQPFAIIDSSQYTPMLPSIFIHYMIWNIDWIKNPSLLLAIAAVFILIVAKRQFEVEGKPLIKKSKIILALFCIVFTMPVTIISLAMLLKARTTDYNFAFVQSQTHFPLLRPLFPDHKVLDSTYHSINKLKGTQLQFIEVSLDYPFNELVEGKGSDKITIRQANYDASGFNTILDSINAATASAVSLKTAANNKALLARSKTKATLVFISKKKTIIWIEGTKPTEVINVGKSLY